MIKKSELKNWSVSQATLRQQDLIKRFASVLEEDSPRKHRQLIQECGKWLADWVKEPGQELDEDAGYLLEELFDALNNIAPSGYYFGAHPGDGADFGFWKVGD